ncbi:uncharacterized protein LOC135202255 [Macrobrachium nipponense]|uniref:uncharacterized protein LOC135202255 n=1 Tax=Macrobrachium nipponense TaxID=159736 RepID=UPI0030C80955
MKRGAAGVCCYWVVAILLLLSAPFVELAVRDEAEAEDCALYETDSHAKTMNQVISTGVLQKGFQFAATLSLTSQDMEKSCHVNILGVDVAISCGNSKMKVYKWSPDLFKENDITELWVHLGPLGEDPVEEGEEDHDEGESTVSTDLVLIGRRGAHRGHILFPASGLHPPITVRWKPMQPMSYYYNCVTGCLFTKSVSTPPGAYSIFFRPGNNFSHLLVAYNSTVTFAEYRMVLNASDVTVDDHWRNLTAVWNKQDGGIGVLIDGRPIRGLESFVSLSKGNGIVTEISGEGAHVRLCDPRFKDIAVAKGTEQVPSFSPVFNVASFDDTEKRSAPDISQNWLVILALACIGLLFLAAIVLLVLLLRTKRQLLRQTETAARNNIAVDTLTSTRTATVKSTAPLYPDPHGGRDNLGGNVEGPKGQLSPVPGGNSNHYAYIGSKT